MEKSITTINTLTIPEVESAITALHSELQEQVTLQAKQDAQKESVITPTEFKVKVTNPIQGKCQSVIDFVKQRGLSWAHLHNTKQFEEQANKECEQLQFECDAKERQLGPLEKRKALLTHDTFKTKNTRWFWLACAVLGIGDAMLAYTSFRHSYSTIMALTTACAIAVVISVSHLGYAPWIKKSKNSMHKWIKIALVLLVAFVFFYWISNLRVDAIANTINISVSSPGTQIPTTTVSHWSVCIVSFILFVGIFTLSLVFWRSPEERMQEQAHKKVCAEIEQTNSTMQALKAKKTELQEKVQMQKNDVRQLLNYLKTSFRRVKAIGDQACKEYKRVYAQFRTTIPDFFADDIDLVFDEALNLELKNYNAA